MTQYHGGRIYADLDLSVDMIYKVVKRVNSVSPER